MNQFTYKNFYRRNLPHAQPEGATLFITFRLANSLPLEVIQRLQEEKEQFEKQLAHFANEDERKAQLILRHNVISKDGMKRSIIYQQEKNTWPIHALQIWCLKVCTSGMAKCTTWIPLQSYRHTLMWFARRWRKKAASIFLLRKSCIPSKGILPLKRIDYWDVQARFGSMKITITLSAMKVNWKGSSSMWYTIQSKQA